MKMKVYIKIIIAIAVLIGGGFSETTLSQSLPFQLYPYVKNGTKIIVHMDEYGGVKKDLLFSCRKNKYLVYDINSTENKKLPAQFEVKVEKKTTGYYSLEELAECAIGWRMPTYNEMLVIFLLKGELGLSINPRQIVTATTNNAFTHINPNRYVVYWDTDCEFASWVASSKACKPTYRVCVRDIDTKSLGLSDL